MFASRSTLSCLLIVAIFLCVTSGERITPALNGQEKDKKKAVKEPRVVGVTVRLDKQEATPGEVVRITEVVPAEREVVAFGTGHTVRRIGDYDPKRDQFVLREPDRYLLHEPFFTFKGLPASESGSGVKEITVKNPREQGFEMEFKPSKLGMYLIEARWKLKDGAAFSDIYGQPVIISVKPPRDKKGRPIVKDEWLPE